MANRENEIKENRERQREHLEKIVRDGFSNRGYGGIRTEVTITGGGAGLEQERGNIKEI